MSSIDIICEDRQRRIEVLTTLEQSIKLMLEDDAKIHELQALYKDIAAETLALFLIQGIEMRKAKMPQKVLSMQDRVCDLAEQVYRLVK